MKAIVLEQPGKLTLTELDFPSSPGPNEALVRVKRVGICGSDLHAFAGNQNFFTYPRIIGHELAVEVVALGDLDHNSPYTVGDLCSVNPYFNCGTCPACLRGKTNCCMNIQVIGIHVDGGMREQFIVPVDKLLKAEDIPVEHLALVEMLCIGAHAVNRAQIIPGENVLIIGAGPIGLATAQFAKTAGGNLFLMEINDKRLEFCDAVLEIDQLIDAKSNPISTITNLIGGDLPTSVFDCTGNTKSMHAAFDFVAHGGSLIYVGHIKGDITFRDPLFHSHEMTLIASRNATDSEFKQVISSLEARKINLSPWITHLATPERIVEEFPSWVDPATGVLKAMLTFD